MIKPSCTLGYAAPELIVAFDEKSAVVAEAARDVWSLGVMVFEALTRTPAVDPFSGIEGCKALAYGKRLYPWEAHIEHEEYNSSCVRELVEACLTRIPAQRPTAATLVEALQLISRQA